ncbi:MAG TPA: GMC oxidoreductase [Thermoanaerobaculia bacterium]|nr:GMC oxidoreductase [Thermoanaerobaculia bacterium]
MIDEGKSFLGRPPHKTQVCIVGTGQAGITLAWYLVKQGIDVTLLEGSRVFNPLGPNEPAKPSYQYNENELLYNGDVGGLFTHNEPQFLIRPTPKYYKPIKERDRIYGGTSTHWGGQSRPLDAISFEKRPGFPGWPITREDLDPFYAEASKFLELYGDYYAPDGTAGYNFSAEFWAKELGQEVADLEGFDVDMYQFVPERNLQFQARRVEGKTIGESKALVIVNASLLNIEHQDGGSSVSSLTVGVMDDNRSAPKKLGEFTVEAQVYVLACGAVANARQLLISKIGNKSDLVGRYLMAHPIADGARAVSVSSSYLPYPQQQLLSYQSVGPKYAPVTSIAGLLTPNAEALRAKQVGSCWFGWAGSDNFYHELLPNRDSRISLADSEDIFDQPKTRADWILNSADEEANFKTLASLFETAVTKKGGGPVDIGSWADIESRMVFNGHHLGTTRMSATEEDGVVDGNLKVHSLDNLFVAGSSVWASAGISNPTFSIVAFSIRLADHLGRQLKGG